MQYKKNNKLDKKSSKYDVSILESEACSDYFDISKNIDKINNDLLNNDKKEKKTFLKKIKG
jgi:hypothetical protein